MRIIETKVYMFDELSDKAKEKARDWYRDTGFCESDVWEQIQEDAKSIGLEIMNLDPHRANKGRFISGAEECAWKIEKEHGESCETYKTAKAFLKERDRIINNADRDENGDFVDQMEVDYSLDKCEEDFLHALLEDYQIMYEKDVEDRNSDEYVDETIIANEYEFDEKGKRI